MTACHQHGKPLFKILTIRDMLEVLFVSQKRGIGYQWKAGLHPNHKVHVIQIKVLCPGSHHSTEIKSQRGNVSNRRTNFWWKWFLHVQIHMVMLHSNYYQGFIYKTMANECPEQCREGHIVPFINAITFAWCFSNSFYKYLLST